MLCGASTSLRFQDLEIDLKCLVTRITSSESARHAAELLKDVQSLIGKVEKLNKTLKKVVIDNNSLDIQGLGVAKKAIASIEASEKDVNHWSARFGFSEDRVRRGTKRKAPDRPDFENNQRRRPSLLICMIHTCIHMCKEH